MNKTFEMPLKKGEKFILTAKTWLFGSFVKNKLENRTGNQPVFIIGNKYEAELIESPNNPFGFAFLCKNEEGQMEELSFFEIERDFLIEKK